MSQKYEIQVNTLNSIYTENKDNGYDRKLNVYFSTPQYGVNKDTGVMLYISGFGGHANSKVCKKMRSEFADKYNLITIQCNYFGYEFMQDTDKLSVSTKEVEEKLNILTEDVAKDVYNEGNIKFNQLLKELRYKNTSLVLKADLNESKKNFNDMGLLQGIDNIVAVISVMNIMYNQNVKFNAKKVILFGNSHGSYLSYLCNALAPTLFTLLIDNSAWIFPQYLCEDKDRFLITKLDKLLIYKKFSYLAKKVIKDKNILDLNNLYKQFENKCAIISYHGTNDDLVSNVEKKEFCSNIDNCIYNEISDENLDNNIFKSASHGLGADFLKLFDHVINNLNFQFEENWDFQLPNKVELFTNRNNYVIDYNNIYPSLNIITK